MSRPKESVVRRLFALARTCAFDGCGTPLLDPSTGKIICEVCHIKGQQPSAARYDGQQSEEERHGFDNLILLCGEHHAIVDSTPARYTVEILQRMKAEHESSKEYPPSDDVLTQLLAKFDTRPNTIESINQRVQVNTGHVVQSFNQMGGQTAHTITNIGRQPRTLSPATAAQIAAALRHHPTGCFTPVAIMGDGESYRLALQLESILIDTGWTSMGISQSMYNGIIEGVRFDYCELTPLMKELGTLLVNAGLRAGAHIHPSHQMLQVVAGQAS